jgi:hypothetical protein
LRYPATRGRIMDKQSTYGLKLEQLANLFSVAAEEENHMGDFHDEKAAAGLLQNQLSKTLPKDSLLLSSILKMLDQPGSNTKSLAGKSLLEVLLNPKSDADLLQAIKDNSKNLSRNSASEAEMAAATIIYYAALAGLLIYHEKKITQYSYDALAESFALLMEKKWIAGELAELFSHARRICESKREEK